MKETCWYRVEKLQFRRLPSRRQVIDTYHRVGEDISATPSRPCPIESPRSSLHEQVARQSRLPKRQLRTIAFPVRICSSAMPMCTSNSERLMVLLAQGGIQLVPLY